MAEPKSDPRFRPYRGLMWVLYVSGTTFLSLLVTISVVRSTLAMSPPDQPPASSLRTVADCVSDARKLWSDLDAHRKALSDQTPAARADTEWSTFRVGWLERLRLLEADCAAKDRPALAQAFASLQKTMNLYTTHAVQYSGAVGPVVDELKAELDAAAR